MLHHLLLNLTFYKVKYVFQKEPLYKSIAIKAHPSVVWRAITDTELMQKWMLDEEIEVSTTWRLGSLIIINGNLHDIYFENRGTILKIEAEKCLQYSHLSSLSKLADEKQNYVIYEFKLSPVSEKTLLSLSIHNFPTESIYQHLNFYWNTTLHILKDFIETQNLN